MQSDTENALLAEGLPRYDEISPDLIPPALDTLFARHREATAAIKVAPNSYRARLMPLERADNAIASAWSTVEHLKAMDDAPPLRAAYASAQQRLSEHSLAILQDRDLFESISQLVESDGGLQGSDAERQAARHWTRAFRLSGVGLEPRAARRFLDIGVLLTRLSTEFSDAVVDATDAWTELHVDEADLAGLPASDRAMMAGAAAAKGATGWLVTLQAPSVAAVLLHADDRALRRRVYEANVTRASECGPHAGRFDNGERISRILALRREAANLLGYADHSGVSLVSKMAHDAGEVRTFLLGLAAKAKPVAQAEYEALSSFARETLAINALEPWDIGYASERLRQARYDFSASEVQGYFPADVAVAGVFDLVERLFGVTARVRPDVQVWCPDATYYELRDRDGEAFSGLYVDLFARAGKRSGAWMAPARAKFRDGATCSLPVAYLTCNFAAPSASTPSLLTHGDVITLLHEMGHVLHHLLTEVEVPSVGGISGFEWDAVELPSQLLETFGWDRAVLRSMSRHHLTGATLPDALYDRMIAARRFQAGLSLLRQVELALFDLNLHTGSPSREPMQILEEVRDLVAVVRPPNWARLPHAFMHIFAHGYAAGYYSYLWAERLALDAFSRVSTEPGAAERYREEILARGASRPAAESFRAFMGRDPTDAALLYRYGLDPASQCEVA